MRYLQNTSKLGFCFEGDKPLLVSYTNVDMAGDVDTRRSTSGFVVTFTNGVVSRQSRLQKCVTLSTTKAKFIASTKARRGGLLGSLLL